MPELNPKIRIRDPLGVELGVVAQGPLLNMFGGFQEFVVALRDGSLAKLLKEPQKLVSEIQLDEISAGLHFDDKLSFREMVRGVPLEYFVDAGILGKLILRRPGSRFNGFAVPPGKVFSILELSAFLRAGAAVPISLGLGVVISPGVRGGTVFELSHRAGHAEATPVLNVVKAAIGGLRFPFNPDSVAELGQGEEISLRLDGTIAVSAALSWGLTADITVDDPKDLDKLDPSLERAAVLGQRFKLGVPIAAQAKLEFVHGVTDEFRLRVRRAGPRRVRLDVEKAKTKFSDTAFDFTVGLVQGLSPAQRKGLNTFLTERFANQAATPVAKLAGKLVRPIEDALVKRAKATFSALYRKIDRGSTLFSFEFDFEQADARGAYSKAAEGDLTQALRLASDKDKGVTLLSTVFESLDRETLEVRFNFVGIFSFNSMSELAQKSIIRTDQAGEVSIYKDSSFKARSDTSLGHVRVADFLFKATWARGNDPGGSRDFDFSLRYAFSEQDQFTSRDEIARTLDIAVLLGVMSRTEKDRILSQPVEFRRALEWPLIGALSPEATYGKSSMAVEAAFDEAALDSILGKGDAAVWSALVRAYPAANPQSDTGDWLNSGVRRRIDDSFANFLNEGHGTDQERRQRVISEYLRAKRFVETMGIFREAVASGDGGRKLLERMKLAGRDARKFHFDLTAFLALNLLCDPGARKVRVTIEGDKVRGVFPLSQA